MRAIAGELVQDRRDQAGRFGQIEPQPPRQSLLRQTPDLKGDFSNQGLIGRGTANAVGSTRTRTAAARAATHSVEQELIDLAR